MAIEGDVVLIYMQDQPIGFARVEKILPDHKPDWYHVTLLLLQIPMQVVTWILRDVYIEGQEFNMGGKPMRIEKVVAPEEPPAAEDTNDKPPESKPNGKAKVISLKDLKK